MYNYVYSSIMNLTKCSYKLSNNKNDILISVKKLITVLRTEIELYNVNYINLEDDLKFKNMKYLFSDRFLGS